MTTETYANDASTTLAAPLSNSATTCTVTSAAGFPAAGSGNQFRILIDSEILLVTGVSGAVFTVARGQEGTAAAAHVAGAEVDQVLTKGAVDQIKADAAAGSLPDLTSYGLRLTLTSGVPVTTADVTAAGTLYFTPMLSGQIALYTSGAWSVRSTAEISLALSLTSGKVYDVFAYWTGSAVALELSAAWTNSTTRADALAQQDGVTVKSADHTRRWVGTIAASGTNTTEDSKANRLVWNVQNQVPRFLDVVEATTSWSDSTTSFRPANNNAANAVQWVAGYAHVEVDLEVIAFVVCSGNTSTVGVGIDSTTVNSALTSAPTEVGSGPGSNAKATYRGYPGLGLHKATWLEYVNQSTSTWYGNTTGGGTPRNGQSGMTGVVVG